MIIAFSPQVIISHGNPTELLRVNMLRQRPFRKIDIYLLVLITAHLMIVTDVVSADSIQKDTLVVHRVSPGESLHKIARRYLPLTEELSVRDLVERIMVLNGIQGSLIRPNQRLLIPLVRSTPVAAKTIPKEVDFEAKGIYVNRYSMATQKIKRLVDELIAAGGNTVILDGKDMSGKLSYRSKVNLANEIGANETPVIGDMAKLIHYLHKRGIHVGVRLVLFYDQLLATSRPELTLRSTATGDLFEEHGKVVWVDPGNTVVQEYNLCIAKELAAMGVDEIQFDYIRFPTTDKIDYASSNLDEHLITRYEIITNFLARAREELAVYKVLLAIDVFGIIAWDRAEDVQMTGQKMEDLAQYCDVISPMIYPSHFHSPFQGIANPNEQPHLLVWKTSRRFSDLLSSSEAILRPWIQAFPLGADNFGENYVLEQLRALSETEARGWLLWSAGNNYAAAWKALAQWQDVIPEGKTISVNLLPDDLD